MLERIRKIRASQLLLLFLFVPAVACRQETETPYAGLETRSIKALSPAEVEAYLNGDGMGFALAAELNHYPGPKHVLALAEELQLSSAQVQEAQQIFRAMADSAQKLGRSIVDLERRLDRAFQSGNTDSAAVNDLVAEIAGLQGALRFSHLAAHLAMKRLLSPEQVATYDRLRGYGDGGEHIHDESAHPAMHQPH